MFIPLPPWGTGWRRRRMPPLVLITRNWFSSLFSRFTVETVHICECFSEVWSEFHWCMSSWFVQCDIPFFLYLSNSSSNGQKEWFSCANLFIAMHVSSVQPILSCESRYVECFRKRSWIPSKFLLLHLLRALWAMKCSFCASVLPCRAPRGRSFLMT